MWIAVRYDRYNPTTYDWGHRVEVWHPGSFDDWLDSAGTLGASRKHLFESQGCLSISGHAPPSLSAGTRGGAGRRPGVFERV